MASPQSTRAHRHIANAPRINIDLRSRIYLIVNLIKIIMSSCDIESRRKKKERAHTEHECMLKFYEPIKNQEQVLKKWLKKPER